MPEQPAPPIEDEVAEPSGSQWIWIAGMGAIAIFLALWLFNIRSSQPGDPEAAKVMVELQQAIQAESAALDVERVRRGLPPLYGDSQAESMAAVAARLRSDAEALANFALQHQEILASKEREIAEGRHALEESRRELSAVTKQIAALQEKLDAVRAGSEEETLGLGAENAAARVAELEQSLAEANARLAEQRNAPSTIEFDDLQRRYEETRRARDFFEARARKLEEELAAAEAPAGEEPGDEASAPELPLPQD